MLADKLSSLRKSRGLTQEELALELFISRSMIAKYETGKAYPTNEILQKIADYFEISIDQLVHREELIDEHSKTLEDNIVKKQRLVTVVAIIGVLILCIVGVLSVIEIDVIEYVTDYAQIEWDADFAAWNLNYYEESNPDIWQRRARLHLSEWDIYENSRTKAQFTIEGEDWFVQFNKYNVSEDYRELKTATLYYRVTVRKNLLGMVQSKVYYLERADFHLQ
ncbi:MAG: helix-turn-helix domain-containing protein [Clostridia bacterium]|nr:helix-turn-helix domain-containing protein [Clostridia bacterium]